MSRILAYEKAVSPKLEEVTCHDKAEILLAQFKESERSADTGKHLGDGSGGGSYGGEVDDSNDDIVHNQYKGAGEKPSDPKADIRQDDDGPEPSHIEANVVI